MMNSSQDIPKGFKLRHTLRGHESEINRIAWSPDGRLLASSSFDKTVKIWDTETGHLVHTLVGHESAVFCVAWSPDGQVLASGSALSIRFWDMRTRQGIKKLSGHKKHINDLAWSPHDNLLASGSADLTIRLWRYQPISVFRTLHAHSNEIYSLAWSSDGSMLASGSLSGVIRCWDRSEGADPLDFYLKGTPLRGVAAFGDNGVEDVERFKPNPSGRMRTKAPSWCVYRSRGTVLATEIRVQVRPNQQQELIAKLHAIQQSDQHTFPGTLARYVLKGDPTLMSVHILLLWKDTEMPDEGTRRHDLEAFQEELADVLDWETAQYDTNEAIIHT